MVLAPEHELAKILQQMRQRSSRRIYLSGILKSSGTVCFEDKEKDRCIYRKLCDQPDQWSKSTNLNGYLIMYLQITDQKTQERSCVYQRMMTVTLNSLRSLTFRSFQVIAKDGKEIENMEEAMKASGIIQINSGDWNGKESSELKEEAPNLIEEMGIGKKTTNYKLRDWVFSRQR